MCEPSPIRPALAVAQLSKQGRKADAEKTRKAAQSNEWSQGPHGADAANHLLRGLKVPASL